MTLRDFFDSFTSSAAIGIHPVVLPTATATRLAPGDPRPTDGRLTQPTR